jgi:hypothetical protein
VLTNKLPEFARAIASEAMREGGEVGMSKKPKEHWCWQEYSDETEQRLCDAYKEFYQKHQDEPTIEEWRVLESQVEASFEGEQGDKT